MRCCMLWCVKYLHTSNDNCTIKAGDGLVRLVELRSIKATFLFTIERHFLHRCAFRAMAVNEDSSFSSSGVHGVTH